MAKKASQKDRQKALRNARKDGKVSGKEAKLLRNLGIPQRQITNTKAGTVKVGGNAKPKPKPTPAPKPKPKPTPAPAPRASKPKTPTPAPKAPPKAPPKSNIYKDAGKTASNAINKNNGVPPARANKVLKISAADGVIKEKEAKKLLDLGIKMKELKQNTEGVRINAGAQKYYRENQKVGDYGRKSSGFDAVDRNKGGGGGGNGGGGSVWNGPLDKKQLRGLQDHIGEYGVRKYPKPDDDEEGWTPGKTPNDIMYSTYNIGDWKTVAKQLNIKNVDTPADVNRLHAYVNNYESSFNNSNNNRNNNNNNNSKADRDSGEFNDIKDALREDIDINNGRADDLDNRGVDTNNPYQDIIDDLTNDLNNNGRGNGGNGGNGGGGGNGGNRGNGGGRGNGGNGGTPTAPAANPYQDIIDQLTASNADLSSYTQQLIDDNAVAQSGYEDSLAAQAESSANALAGLNDLFTSSFTGVNDQMALQQTDFTAAQAFTQDQLASQQDAFNTAQAYAQEQMDLQQGAFSDALLGMNDQLVAQQGEFGAALTGLNNQMAQQQEDFNTAQAYTQEQLSNANAAFLAEQTRAANMRNAFVPGANPNALSVGYGDGRKKKRQTEDNLLSDLTLMSGLGTQSNPLAGLQLA